jgi:hypothetical protein
MSKVAFESMSFYEGGDGSLTDIVARKSLFKNKEDFLKWILNDSEEYETHYDDLELSEVPTFEISEVKEGYVRYFRNFGEDSGMSIESGYTFCDKGRGAFKVYYVNFQ